MYDDEALHEGVGGFASLFGAMVDFGDGSFDEVGVGVHGESASKMAASRTSARMRSPSQASVP